MGLFSDIFLSKQDKQIVEIYENIRKYWKNTNDFTIAHVRYLQDLNHKYKLDFSLEVIEELPYSILTPLLESNISHENAMFIFSQFVTFYIYRQGDPKLYRYSDNNLFSIASNIKKLLVPYKSRVTPEFTFQIDRNIDVIERFGNKNYRNYPAKSLSNRELSKSILALNSKCNPEFLREEIFIQLDSMNATEEICRNLILRNKDKKFDQAQQYNMHPDDTPSAIFEELIIEYIEKLSSKPKTKEQLLNEIKTLYPVIYETFMIALARGEHEKAQEILKKNPEFMDMMFLINIDHNKKEENDEPEELLPTDDLPF